MVLGGLGQCQQSTALTVSLNLFLKTLVCFFHGEEAQGMCPQKNVDVLFPITNMPLKAWFVKPNSEN